MQEDKDFFKREIQRLTLFLQKLLGKIEESDADKMGVVYDEVEKNLKEVLGISLDEISALEADLLTSKLNGINESLLEIVLKMAFTLSENTNGEDFNKLKQTSLRLIDYLDQNSKTFSLERNQMKIQLQNTTQK